LKDQITIEIDPVEFDWTNFLHTNYIDQDLTSMRGELDDRKEDLSELSWLLSEIRKELKLYRNTFPGGPFELDLEMAFARQIDVLEKQVGKYKNELEKSDLNAYLAVKYAIRTLYKQLGAVVAGSDWQSPCKRLKDSPQAVPQEAGFPQEEQGTYMRSYGSETVKDHEEASMKAFYSLSEHLSKRSVGFLTTSGMKALELALVAYKSFTREALPFYCQRGFYGEGIDLARILLSNPLELISADICELVESNKPIGGLLVDPGLSWPVRPAMDLARLFAGLSHHKQNEPLYVIVDRTFTSAANPLFERYSDLLPPHVVLISVESGIKYMQYGLDLANVGYLVALGRSMENNSHKEKWIGLLSLLDAGAEPVTARQLPTPDSRRLETRLSRLNRNAYWMDAFLTFMASEGKIAAFYRSVDPSPQLMLDKRQWMGSVFYIQFPGNYSEQDYQDWIDRFVKLSPQEEHFVSGGSFGFDTFRMNAVCDADGKENALRVSVGRDPLGQFLLKLKYMYSQF
jgi:hypothetical protein